MANEYEMLFKLNAALASNFQSTFTKADSTLSSTQQKINDLYKVQSEISSFEKQQKAVDATERKLADLQKEYDNIQREIDETEGFSSDLENQLVRKQAQIDKTTESLNGQTQKLDAMEAELKEAGVDTQNLTGESERLEAEMNDLAENTDKTGDKAVEFGEEGAAAFELLGDALISAGIFKGLQSIKDVLVETIMESAAYADNIETLSAKFGVSTDALQAYTYAAELVDVDVNTITSSMTKNVKSMYNAEEGSAKVTEAYEKLGVSVMDADGNLRDSETVYWEVIDALGAMTNESERDGIAMTLLGRSALELNPLIKAGSESMAAYTKEAQNMGFIMSGSAFQAAQKLDDAEQRLKNTQTALKNQLGAELAPAMTKVKEAEAELLTDVIQFIQKNPALVKTVVALGTGLGIVVGAYAAYKTVKTGLIAIKKVYNLLQKEEIVDTATETAAKAAETVVTEEATVAQIALNAAMYACPILLAVGGIAALVGALGGFSSAADSGAASMDGLNQSIADMPSITQPSGYSAPEVSEYEKEVRASELWLGQLESFAAEGASGLKNHASEVIAIVDSLNEEYEGLGLTFDATTGKLNYSIEDIEKMTTAYRINADDLNKTKEYLALMDKMAELQAQRAALEAEYAAASDGVYEEGERLLTEIIADMENVDGQIQATQESLDGYSDFVEYENTVVQIDNIITSIQSLKAAYDEAYTSAYNSISGQYQLWDTAEVVAATSVASTNTALETQESYWSDYNTDLEALIGKSDSIEGLGEMIATFADGSPESVNMIAGLADATDEEIASMVENWQSVQKQQEEAAANLAELKTGYQNDLDDYQDLIEETVEGMNLDTEAETAAKSTVEAYIDALKNGSSDIAAWAEQVKAMVRSAMMPDVTPGDGEGVGGYASGTSYAQPGWKMVGENGPELEFFNGGERVLTASQTEAVMPMLGGMGTSVTVAPSIVVNGNASTNAADYVEVSDMIIANVIDALEEAGIDAKRSMYA